MAQLDRAPYEARRRAIDVSGDGDNNTGRDVTIARDEVVAKGITINGLVILSRRKRPRILSTTPGTLTRWVASQTTTATASPAAPARSSWSRRT
jgi:hypothetical protein